MNSTPTGSNGPRLRRSRRAPPEKVTIAADDREAADALLAHEVEDFCALGDVAAPVAAAERRIAAPGHGLLRRPDGRFCGSVRQSSVPSELPQIFQVAVEL